MTVKEAILDAFEKYSTKLKNVLVSYSDIVNNLTSTATNLPLSAAQGKTLNDKATTLQTNSAVLSNGTRIPANADLNDYTTPGVYHSPHSTTTDTLSNVPMTGVGFKLIVMHCGYSGTSYLMQLFIRSTSASMASSVWARITSNSGVWQDWNLLTLADQNSLFISASSYATLYNCMVKLPVSKVATLYMDAALVATLTNNAITGSTFRGIALRINSSNEVDIVGTTGAGQRFIHLRINMGQTTHTLTSLRMFPLSRDTEPLTQIKSYTYKYTVAANTSVSISAEDFGMSTPSGYEVLAIRTFYTGSTNTVVRAVTPTATGTNSVMLIRNVSSSQVSNVTAGISIAYIKSLANP